MNPARARLDAAATWSGTLGRPTGGLPRTPSWLAPQGMVARLLEESPALVRRSPSAPPPPENPYAAAGAQRRATGESAAPPPMPDDAADDPRADDDGYEEPAPEDDPREAAPLLTPPPLEGEGAQDEGEVVALRVALDAAGAERDALEARALEAEARVEQARADVLAESEGQLLRLALAIAERVVAREIRTDPTLVARWVEDALAALAAIAPDARPSVAVGLALAGAIPGDAWTSVLGPAVRVERDPSLAPLGCEVRAGVSAVDVSPLARLASVRAELLGDVDEGDS